MLRTLPPWRQVGKVLRDVGPRLPGVARQLHQTVVGARPDQTPFLGRFRDPKHNARILDADVVRRQAPGTALPGLVVQRQVRTNCRPTLPAVGRAMHVLAADVDCVAVVRRDVEWRVPHEPVPQVARRAVRLVGPDLHVAKLSPVLVEADHDAANRAGARRRGPHEFGIDRIGGGPPALAAAHRMPHRPGNDPVASAEPAL